MVAYADVRGGGARGFDWYQAAVGPRKLVAVHDYLDTARFLIEQGYTAPDKLVAQAASAGGVVVGTAVAMHPELFAAAVFRVGVVNLFDFLQWESRGEFFEFEYGSLANEGNRTGILKVDALYNLEAGKTYPPMLLTASVNDPRVPVWQPAKFVAKLQSLGNNQAFLRVDFGGGHWTHDDEQLAELTADIEAFAWIAVTGGIPEPLSQTRDN